MENDLAARVMSLPREIVLEAARFVAEDLVTDPPTAGEVAWVGDQPLAHVQDVEVLARLVLLCRSMEGEQGASEVEAAISGAGRKNLVLGGLEIVALAGLGVVALRLILTKGKVTDEKVEMIQDPRTGAWSVTAKRTEKPIAISGDLATVFRGFVPTAKG